MQIPEFNDEQDRQRSMNHRDSECPKHLVREEEDQGPDAQEDIDEILDKINQQLDGMFSDISLLRRELRGFNKLLREMNRIDGMFKP